LAQPKYEGLDTQVLGVSVDVIGALQAFAEKLGVTYPMLSDFSRSRVKAYGVMDDAPKSAYFRMAKRAYFVIDKHGIIRSKQMPDYSEDLASPDEILAMVKKAVGVKRSRAGRSGAHT
jgi:glutaredoxin-dependent peroxiredoxin